MHTPVLLKAAIEGLNVKPGGKYIDATFGEGGHSLEILNKGGDVLGIEADERQYQISKIKYQNYILNSKNLILIRNNFKNIEEIAKENGFEEADGVLFDLGLSMRQLNESGRGFSYKKPEEPLDMRLDLKQELTASQILNNKSKEEIYELLIKNSEELNSWKIAEAIVETRKSKEIKKVGDLVNILAKVGLDDERTKARVFQALRIEVNDEFENLKKGLNGALNILKREGRIVVITFHSLEDRIVKRFIKNAGLKQVNKKIKEKTENKFERSAKLRVIGY